MSTFTRKEDELHAESIWRRWGYLLKLVRLLWRLGPVELLLLIPASVIGGLAPLGVVVLLRYVVDSAVAVANGSGETQTALFWLGALVVANVVQSVVEMGNGWMGEDIKDRWNERAREKLLNKAGSLSLSSFENPERYDHLRRANRALEERVRSTVEGLIWVPVQMTTAIALLVYLGTAHILLPIALLVAILPLVVINVRMNRRLWLLAWTRTPSERRLEYLNDLMTERPAAAEMRLYGIGTPILEQRQGLAKGLRLEELKLSRDHLVGMVSTNVAQEVVYGGVIVGIVGLIVRGVLTVGQFVALLAAAERFRNSMWTVFIMIANMDSDLRYIADLINYLELEDDVEPEKATSTVALALATRDAPAVQFKGVTFSYPGTDEAVLDRLDLEIGPGERVALVGENGAGKTTMAKLLLGLYRPTEGRIVVDGVDMSEVEPSEWRKHVAAVFQDYMRFELTARENIGFGDLSRLDEQPAIEAASVKSGSAEFVATLPAGYDTVLGRAFDENGQDLSSGQWQRLAGARAYFRDASVLVLDEPTAALDPKAEVEVYRSFADMSVDKSVLLISHRLGSARLADRVVFLEGGRIAEEGSHAELVQSGGRYAEMYAIQAEWYR